jgi:hypothetical protein
MYYAVESEYRSKDLISDVLHKIISEYIYIAYKLHTNMNINESALRKLQYFVRLFHAMKYQEMTTLPYYIWYIQLSSTFSLSHLIKPGRCAVC